MDNQFTNFSLLSPVTSYMHLIANIIVFCSVLSLIY